MNWLLLRPFYFLVILKKVPCEKASILWSLLREEGEGSGSCDEPKAEDRWEPCVRRAVTIQPSRPASPVLCPFCLQQTCYVARVSCREFIEPGGEENTQREPTGTALPSCSSRQPRDWHFPQWEMTVRILWVRRVFLKYRVQDDRKGICDGSSLSCRMEAGSLQCVPLHHPSSIHMASGLALPRPRGGPAHLTPVSSWFTITRRPQ